MDKEKLYRAALIQIKLAENNEPPREVQVLRVGTFFDPRYGQFQITKQMLLSMKKNFDDNVRKLSLAFDFKHESEDIAAGWFQTVNLRNDDTELWAEVEWTVEGARKLADRLFRYVSADFSANYIDNETLKEHGPCLLGAALTNRPVIKGMDPITLTEGEGKMDEKDKLIAQLQAKIADLEKQLKGGSEDKGEDMEMGKMKEAMAAKEKELADMKAKCSEYEAATKKAAEEKQLAEKKARFEKLLSEGKAVKAQEEAYIAGDMDKFFELSEKTHSKNEGHSGEGNNNATEKSALDQILELAEKKVEEKLAKDSGSAISLVLDENPELKKAYESGFKK